MQIEKIILASTSSFRKQLLATTGVSFECIAANVDEESISANGPSELAVRRATAKAIDVSRRHHNALVIGCDQVLDFKGQAYGKASHRDQAFMRLKEFSGHEHQLLSAYTLFYNEQELMKETVVIRMRMRDLSDADINAYLDTNEWVGCAGCYQYENRGGLLFEPAASDCDFSAIVGLPLRHLNTALLQLGVNILTVPKGPWTLIRKA